MNNKIMVNNKERTFRFNPKRLLFEHNFGYKDILGTRHSRIIRGKSVEELSKEIAKYEANLLANNPLTSNATFGSFFQYYIDNFTNKLAPSTIHNKNMIVHSMGKDLLNIPLKDITTPLLQTIYNRLYEKYKPNTVYVFAEQVSVVLNKAIDLGILHNNPNRKCSIEPRNNGVKHYLSPNIIVDFFKWLKTSKYSVLYRPLLFMIYTGVRRGECIGLKKQDVDCSTGVVSIRGQIKMIKYKTVYSDKLKTKSSYRKIQLPKEILGIITQYADDSEFVFTTARGSRWGTVYFSRKVKQAFLEFGLPNISPKQFRNSFVKTAVMNNVSLKVIQNILGHSKLSTTTDIYGELTSEDTYFVADVINKAYKFA